VLAVGVIQGLKENNGKLKQKLNAEVWEKNYYSLVSFVCNCKLSICQNLLVLVFFTFVLGLRCVDVVVLCNVLMLLML